MQPTTCATLIAAALVACGGEDSPQNEVQDEASVAGTVVSDAEPAALYRVHATYDGPPVLEAWVEVTFYITRQSSTSTATTQLDIWLVEGEDMIIGAAGDLPPESTGQPILVALPWSGWCYEPPCDATADITIDLLPATGGANPPVMIDTLTATSTVTYETEGTDQAGTVEVTLEQVF